MSAVCMNRYDNFRDFCLSMMCDFDYARVSTYHIHVHNQYSLNWKVKLILVSQISDKYNVGG